jgi:cation diffusion facilitator CzcD-associated flavoprotein CzcO
MNKAHVLIVGAGPAGLAVAGRLRKKGIPFDLIEQSQQVGHAWHNHYERLHLHTVKEHSALPHLPFPEDYPQYVSRQQLADYLEAYAKKFQLRPHFGHSLQSIKREGRKWIARCENGVVFETNHLVLATGVNRVPHVPTFEGQELYQGTILHSRMYRDPKPFLNDKVLVIGMGNTGAEIALDLSEQDIPTYLSVRSPVNIVPRDFLGRPTQKTAFMLAKLPNWLGDWIGQRVQGIAFGDLRKYGLQPSPMPPARQLREQGKTPVIDLGTVDQIKAGKIKVVPGIQRFAESGAIFTDGSAADVSKVILATGYHAKVGAFLPKTEGLFNADGLPKDCIGEGDYQRLYFVGFDNYKPGGILGVVYKESERVVEAIDAAV